MLSVCCYFSAQALFSKSFFLSVIGGRHKFASSWLFRNLLELLLIDANSSLLGLEGLTGRLIPASPDP